MPTVYTRTVFAVPTHLTWSVNRRFGTHTEPWSVQPSARVGHGVQFGAAVSHHRTRAATQAAARILREAGPPPVDQVLRTGAWAPKESEP